MKKIILIILILFSQKVSSEITLIVPYAAGGAYDIMSRKFAKFVTEQTNEKIVVTNILGAGGLIGLKKLESIPNSFSITSNSFYYMVKDNQLSLNDFQYVSILAETPYFLAVLKDSELTCDKLLNQNKNYFIGTSGVNSSSSIPANIIIKKYSNFNEIPYKGQSQAILDLLGKRIDIIFLGGKAERQNITLLANTSTQSVQEIPSWSKCLGITKTYMGQYLMLTNIHTDKITINKMKQLSLQFVNHQDTIEYYKLNALSKVPSNIDVELVIKSEINSL
jgi:tripartite-type tricarboxylate transporter receptor subunit TctC